MATIEFARNVCGLEGATTEEIDENTPHPVVHLLPEQKHVLDKGASMRLGGYPCRLGAGTKAAALYGEDSVLERHRHRYEFNNDYRETMSKQGLVFSGVSPDYRLVEIVELPSHPYFIATQFHPEFRSRPNRAHPLFAGLIAAALTYRESHPGTLTRPITIPAPLTTNHAAPTKGNGHAPTRNGMAVSEQEMDEVLAVE